MTCNTIWRAKDVGSGKGVREVDYQIGGIIFWNTFDEIWSGCKDMRFQNENRHILWDWINIHVRGYEEQIPFIKAKELVKGSIKLEYQAGGIRFWNNFDEMWSGCKDMIFWSVNRNIRWVRCKIHVTGYDEQMR